MSIFSKKVAEAGDLVLVLLFLHNSVWVCVLRDFQNNIKEREVENIRCFTYETQI